MKVTVLDRWGNYPGTPRNQLFLTSNNWDDFGFRTAFGIFYIDENSKKHDLDGVKIAFKGQKAGERVFKIGDSFDNVGGNCFSQGSSETYYERLKELPDSIREEILTTLNDIAFDLSIYATVENESVVATSFLRSISPVTLTRQYHRMAHGGATLSNYSFYFDQFSIDKSLPRLKLHFEVIPESTPPTNVHVLIGRNGVGKTRLINNMIDSLSIQERKDESGGILGDFGNLEPESRFANLIFVSFSAFDENDNRNQGQQMIDDMRYSYIGLKADFNSSGVSLKSLEILKEEFWNSLADCMSGPLSRRWIKTVESLRSDPNFYDSGVLELIKMKRADFFVSNIFGSLSSGHKVVLLTITRLIASLQEQSLVIMDEPEAHLHPPLLSAFIRAVSDLLIATNGVAIIATHSPVILQEVPKSCVWKLRRSGDLMIAERPTLETFGENVGTLTNEIFGLEVTDSGFFKMIRKALKEHDYKYEAVLQSFNGQLGSEARSILIAEVSNSPSTND